MNISTLAALFVFSVLVARMLGKETLGLYTLFTAALMPFVFLVDLGQSTWLVREMGRAPNKGAVLLKNTLVIKLFLCAIASVTLLVFSTLFFEQKAERQLFWLFSLILLPRAFYSTFEAAIRAHQKMVYPMFVSFAVGCALIAGSHVLLRAEFGFGTILGFLVALELFKAILIWLIYRRKFRFEFLNPTNRIDWSLCPGLIRGTLPFFLVGIVGILHYRVDVLILASLRDNAEVGVFSAAGNFVNVLRFAPSVIVSAFFPVISAMKKNSAQVRALSIRTLGVQFAASFVLTTAVFALAQWLVLQTYDIHESINVLRVLVWSIIPMALYSTLIYVFYQSDKSAWSLLVLSTAVLVNVSLNLLLIPRFGAMALAISTVASETICLLISLALFRCLLKRPVALDSGEGRLTSDELRVLSYKTTT